jgi:hypothetical protein
MLYTVVLADLKQPFVMIRIFDSLCYFEETLSHLAIRAIIALAFCGARRDRHSCDRIPEALLLLIFWQCGVDPS